MRPLLALPFALLALLPAACDNKPAETAGGEKPAETAAAAPGVPGPHYQTTDEGNAKFLADYAALPGVQKTGDGLMYRVIKAGTGKTPLTTADILRWPGVMVDASSGVAGGSGSSAWLGRVRWRPTLPNICGV